MLKTTTGERRHDIQGLLARIRSEYLEMPGLRLTASQAQRLWCLDPETCDSLLSELVEDKFLKRSRSGEYLRAGR
jgi:hypothetical protein